MRKTKSNNKVSDNKVEKIGSFADIVKAQQKEIDYLLRRKRKDYLLRRTKSAEDTIKSLQNQLSLAKQQERERILKIIKNNKKEDKDWACGDGMSWADVETRLKSQINGDDKR